MACLAGPGEKKIRPWLGPAAMAKKKSGHGSRARPAAARTGQDPHLNTFCAYACAPAWGEKSCRRKIQPWLPAWLAEKNHAMAGPSWPGGKNKSRHGSGWLAEVANCHGVIFFRRKSCCRKFRHGPDALFPQTHMDADNTAHGHVGIVAVPLIPA